MTQVDRRRVLAYRAAAQQLHRPSGRAADLAVAGLGVQDTPYGSARLALAARGVAPDDDRLELVWSMRGAPHLHRRAELPALAAAVWPLSDADATRRIGSGQIRAGARSGLAAFAATVEAFAEVVTAPMPKGEVSRAVSDRVPAQLTYDCGPCAARHISGSLFQQAGLAGGVHLVVSGRATTLAPLAGWSGRPAAADPADLVRTYLRLLGPATPADVAGFLGTSAGELRAVWPAELAEVRVDGRRAWLAPEDLPALASAEPLAGVRLLPPGDPFLAARDRAVLVPGKAHQAQLWRIIGNPGALLVDGDVAGTWRARQAGRTAVEITVRPFAGGLPARVRRELDAEAGLVARARGLGEARVRVETG
ncbi:winged helix DNA-binding domain-containing protein [Micromonospora sp. NPDC126480]|uniref:winged helix DNA-binding domain-containing protein n=1 Tax=Micromonospora sp. NPDC126480 TaxID=3155312 RepID=UPI00331830CA